MWQRRAVPAWIRAQLLASQGEPLDAQTAPAPRTSEPNDRVARDINVHADGPARAATHNLGADALTIGNHIFLSSGLGASSPEQQQLLRHEMTHVIQSGNGPGPSAATELEVAAPDGPQEQQASGTRAGPVAADPAPAAGRALVHRQPKGSHVTEAAERSSFPWNGRIAHTWTAAMRSAPHKDPADPHLGTTADLDAGTEVVVVNRKSGWLRVQLTDGRAGWVSQELVEYVSPSAFDVGEIVISMDIPTIAEAFVRLKRAETARIADPTSTPPADDADAIDLAIAVLEKTGKYTVDRTSYRVSFTPTGKKLTIDTIEDFILFVEAVERTYPSATPAQVASEIRQIWFSDPNWELLSAGKGIVVGGKAVDIETEPDPIALAFDMKDLAPARAPSKPISTPMGTIGMGHVLAGIDTALSGFPTRMAAGAIMGEPRLKYDTLAAATAGDPRDFATWSGDLGQAYGDYLVAKYIQGSASASLASFVAAAADPAALTADIHGYIAAEVTKDMPAADSPTGSAKSVSAILRNLYLVPKTAATGLTYRQYFEKVTGKTGAALDAFMQDRIVAFARPWFAKKTVATRGGWRAQKGWTEEGILENALDEFDKYNKENEASAGAADRVAATVAELNRLLAGRVK
jgi:Domain of unknown function (DUF4157)